MSITSTSASFSIHAAFLLMLLLLSSRGIPTRQIPSGPGPLFIPVDLWKPPRSAAAPGGGGSVANMTLPAAQGMLPRSATRMFVPPLQVRDTEQPLLELPPATPADVPSIRLSNWGNPLGQIGPPSDGRGRGARIGDGVGDGLGDGRGSHYGPGLSGVRGIGGGVTAPRLLHKIEPEYSEEARKAKYQGSVLLRVIVDEHGLVRHVEVARPLGLGLDEKAIDAVRSWRFQPGRQDGQPVPVWAVVEVNFRLL